MHTQILGRDLHVSAIGRHPAIVPIPGTRRRERLEENAAATQVALSADEVAELNATAARGARQPLPRHASQPGRPVTRNAEKDVRTVLLQTT
jgi:hypothetical protein